MPEVVTVRTLVLSVVVLLAVVLLLPTVRAYVNQTGELRELRAQLAAAESERQDLEVELGRWDDRSFVMQQARDRLNYVMPGDTPWRVVSPLPDSVDPPSAGTPRVTPGRDSGQAITWYEAVWGSVRAAGSPPGDNG